MYTGKGNVKMNHNSAQINMIKQQIQTWGVNDTKILDLLLTTPRNYYTPAQYDAFAYTDMEIPLDHNEFMLLPQIEAKILQLLEIKPDDKVLEIGTGSGYFTALLAKMAKSVITVDINEDFSTTAKHKHKSQGIYNIKYETTDASNGFSENGPYNIIIITGGLYSLPEQFKKDLKVNGKIFAFLGEKPNMEATVIKHTSIDAWSSQVHFETSVALLKGASEKEIFSF
ncbi:MAG: protein-L-isoaspartate(D-aspartate) O-methyltransferase [Francisellaceae bacterium]|jgi:protein-L-isoaspartate(D-aspartate) O-methyltransferase